MRWSRLIVSGLPLVAAVVAISGCGQPSTTGSGGPNIKPRGNVSEDFSAETGEEKSEKKPSAANQPAAPTQPSPPQPAAQQPIAPPPPPPPPSPPPVVQQPQPQQQPNTGNRLVYVTAADNRYHLPGCPYIRGVTVRMTEAKAAAQGFAPCPACVSGQGAGGY